MYVDIEPKVPLARPGALRAPYPNDLAATLRGLALHSHFAWARAVPRQCLLRDLSVRVRSPPGSPACRPPPALRPSCGNLRRVCFPGRLALRVFWVRFVGGGRAVSLSRLRLWRVPGGGGVRRRSWLPPPLPPARAASA